MTTRWLIRGSAIALLTFCVSVWAWSYFHSLFIACNPSVGKSCFVQIYTGGVALATTNGIDGSPPGWRFEYDREAYSFDNAFVRYDKQFLGFTYYKQGVMVRAFGIPLWFPCYLSAGLLWFVWWQTRPKIARRGFPVEITQPNEELL